MTEIALLCDKSETDELGIRLTANQMGVDLEYLPFYKTAFSFNHEGYKYCTQRKDYTEILNEAKVIINRCQSKNRRLNASAIIEALGKKVINSQSIEFLCYSKLRTLLAFASAGIEIPRTVYASPNVKENRTNGKIHDNSESICELIEQSLDYKIVIKPDAGTHGRGVQLTESKSVLKSALGNVRPGVTNTSGVLAQEYVSKWFFDLRIIVSKEKGSPPICHVDALARGGFKDFRTNTALGNMVFKASLPKKVKDTAETCAKIIGKGQDAWVIALDAMPRILLDMKQDEKKLRDCFKKMNEPFKEVKRVKARPDKMRQFEEYTDEITKAYTDYMNTDSYRYIESVINETLSLTSRNVCFHEGNACPEFWEQTRVVAGINLAEDILRCAKSLIDR